MFNRKGYSINELMVVIGLAAIVSLAVGTIIYKLYNNRKNASVIDTLMQKKLAFQKIFSEEQTFKNTIASTDNSNFECLRKNISCDPSFVSTHYANTQDRIVLYDNSPSPGKVFYDSRPTSQQGFTESGAACTGFVAAGEGSDDCPIGYLVTWYINSTGSTLGLSLTLTAKMIFNPSSSHKLKNFLNANLQNQTLQAYDVTVTKNVQSLIDFFVPSCKQSGVKLYNKGTYSFFNQAAAPVGERCKEEIRVCSIINDSPILSGSKINTTCIQHCFGAWDYCSAPCGGGTQTYIVSIPANEGGRPCANNNGDTQVCNASSCTGPINCVGSWSSCANGKQWFQVTGQASNGGLSCPNSDGDTQPCGVACSGSWSECLNGIKTYKIESPAAAGGTDCLFSDGATQVCP